VSDSTSYSSSDDAPWIELCHAACLDAGVPCDGVRVLTTWDRGYSWNAIYEIDSGHFVKLYGPRSMTLYRMEKTLLEMVAGGAVSAPRIVAAGKPSDARPYLILTQMPGETAEHAWDRILRHDQLGIARELGAAVAALHATDPGILADTRALPGSLRETAPMNMAKNCEHIEATEGLSAAEADEFTAFIRDEGAALLAETTCIVHCELTNNHIYLRQDRDRWRLSGLIDFADAMVSAPEFDIAWLWPWTFSRDAEAMRVCLDALYDGRDRPDDLARRSLAATLCSYSAEGLWDEYIPQRPGAASVADMTEWLFPAATFGPRV
jgi:hygromycin-B 7''-O-kinase